MDFTELFYSHGTLQWQPVAITLFAIAFIITGFFRTVEFQGIGLKPSNRRILITLHCLGVLLFASALFLSVAQAAGDLRTVMFVLFVLALGFFAPGQFVIGMAQKRALESKMISEGQTVVRRQPLLFKLFKKTK